MAMIHESPKMRARSVRANGSATPVVFPGLFPFWMGWSLLCCSLLCERLESSTLALSTEAGLLGRIETVFATGSPAQFERIGSRLKHQGSTSVRVSEQQELSLATPQAQRSSTCYSGTLFISIIVCLSTRTNGPLLQAAVSVMSGEGLNSRTGQTLTHTCIALHF